MKEEPSYVYAPDPEEEPRSQCLACGDPIPYGGRPDRKFCSEKCRHDYHNDRRALVRGVHLRIISAIEKNYRILHYLLDQGRTSASCTDLLMLGFRPEYMTSCTKDARFLECRTFEISYRQTPNRIFDLKKEPADLQRGAPPDEEALA